MNLKNFQICKLSNQIKPRVVAHISNPSPPEVESGLLLQSQGHTVTAQQDPTSKKKKKWDKKKRKPRQ